jgi:hypothetical protein
MLWQLPPCFAFPELAGQTAHPVCCCLPAVHAAPGYAAPTDPCDTWVDRIVDIMLTSSACSPGLRCTY